MSRSGDIVDAMYLSQFRDPRTGEIDLQEAEEFEHGWNSVSEFVTDGVNTWLETQRYLYYSPEEARSLFLEHVKANNWAIKEEM
jgi:hypothetical protein